MDCFVNFYNTKVKKFYSGFWNPGCSRVDFFVQNLTGENLNVSERGWEIARHLCKPETKSRVCITVENSPNPSIRPCKHRNKVFYCFYKITSSKNYNAGKDEKFIFLIKTYLPTTLI